MHSSPFSSRGRKSLRDQLFEKKSKKKRGISSSSHQNLRTTFPFPLFLSVLFVVKKEERGGKKVAFPYLYSKTYSFFTQRRVLLGKERALHCYFFFPSFSVFLKPQRDVVDGFFFAHLLLGEGDFEPRK